MGLWISIKQSKSVPFSVKKNLPIIYSQPHNFRHIYWSYIQDADTNYLHFPMSYLVITSYVYGLSITVVSAKLHVYDLLSILFRVLYSKMLTLSWVFNFCLDIGF